MTNFLLSLFQRAVGIKDANVALAIVLTITVLLASYLFFKMSSYFAKSTSSPASKRYSDKDTLECVYRENGGESWADEYSKNWLSEESWNAWKSDVSRNVHESKNKWAGVEIDIAYGKEYVVDIQMRDNINFTGSFPNLFALKRLLSIDFDHCKLTGVIPKEIGLLSNLTYLNLSFNQFTGGIPEEIGNLTKLTFLNLNRNPLGGNIPSSIGKMVKLEHLWLANCKLTGPIPYDIGHLIELRDLVICENRISGKIPQEIGVMTKLDRLILSMNEMTGRLPDSLCQCRALTLLYLDRNKFSGELPNEITELNHLKELWIYSTNITLNGKPLVRGVEKGLLKFMPYTDIVVEQPTSPTRVIVRKKQTI